MWRTAQARGSAAEVEQLHWDGTSWRRAGTRSVLGAAVGLSAKGSDGAIIASGA